MMSILQWRSKTTLYVYNDQFYIANVAIHRLVKMTYVKILSKETITENKVFSLLLQISITNIYIIKSDLYMFNSYNLIYLYLIIFNYLY